MPFLFGQKVEVIRDTHVTDWGLDIHIPMGSVGRVIQAQPGKAPWIKFPDQSRHIPIPNLHLLPIDVQERVQTRFIR